MTAPRRRWFAFSLRTLFVVVTVFGCWLGYQLNWIRERHAAQKQSGVIIVWWANTFPRETTNLPLSLHLLGEQGAQEVWVSNGSDQRFRELFPEARIRVSTGE